MEDAYQKQISCLRELQIGARKKRVRVIEEIPKKQCTKPLYLYQVLIDFAGSDRKWQMFFDPDYPGHYPDFVFDIPFLLDASDLETYNDTVKFVVPVDVDLSLLPPHSKESHPVENRCSLSLNFETPNQSQTNATLEIPRSVENDAADSEHS